MVTVTIYLQRFIARAELSSLRAAADGADDLDLDRHSSHLARRRCRLRSGGPQVHLDRVVLSDLSDADAENLADSAEDVVSFRLGSARLLEGDSGHVLRGYS